MIDYSEGSGKQYHTGVGKGDVGDTYSYQEIQSVVLKLQSISMMPNSWRTHVNM